MVRRGEGKPRAAAIIVLAALFLASDAAAAKRGEASIVRWQEHGHIAHALGHGPGRELYCNCLEAFERSYMKGFRVFEADLVRLGDGSVFVAHDGMESHFGLREGVRFGDVSARELRGRRFDGKYAALFGVDLVRLMHRYPDVTVVLDTKAFKSNGYADDLAIALWFARHAPDDVRRRMVPHVHTQTQMDGLREIGGWGGYMLALYRKAWSGRLEGAPAFVRRNRIDSVMNLARRWTSAFEHELRDAGMRWPFAHFRATKGEETPSAVAKLRSRGIGVYAFAWLGEESVA